MINGLAGNEFSHVYCQTGLGDQCNLNLRLAGIFEIGRLDTYRTYYFFWYL